MLKLRDFATGLFKFKIVDTEILAYPVMELFTLCVRCVIFTITLLHLQPLAYIYNHNSWLLLFFFGFLILSSSLISIQITFWYHGSVPLVFISA